MAMNLNFINIFKYYSFISPSLLAFTIIVISTINNEAIKSIIYLGTLLITMFSIKSIIKFSDDPVSVNSLCSTWNFGNFLDDDFNRPSLSLFFIGYTLAYLSTAMFSFQNVNWGLLSVLFTIYLSNASFKLMYNCTSWKSIVISLLTSSSIGILVSLLLYHNYPNLLFFNNPISNNTQCGKKGKKFVCSVYKNGQLIQNI